MIPFCIPLLFLFLIEWVLGDRDEPAEAILALSAAAFCAAVVVGIATGGDSVRRYNYPCMLPALLLLYIFSRRANATPTVRRCLSSKLPPSSLSSQEPLPSGATGFRTS